MFGRALRVVAVAAALALAAAGCTQGSATNTGDSNGKTKVVFFTFSAVPDHVGDLDKIVAAFEKENPDIDVQVTTAPFTDYFTKLQTDLASGAGPDTFELNYENFVTYVASKTVLELTTVDAAAYKPDSLEAFSSDGKQYGLPASFSTVLLFYNKTLFDAAKVATPTTAWTWQDELAAAQKLTNKSAGVFGDYQPVSFHEFYKVLAQNGGSFFSADGKKSTFNDAKGVAAAEFLVNKVGSVQPTVAEIGGKADYDTQLFKSGKLAMWHNGNWQFAGLADVPFEWDVIVEPAGTTKANAVFQNAVVANAKTKNSAAATKWLSYLTASKVAAETRVSSSWELPAVADESLIEPYLKAGKPANRQAVLDALDAIALPPVIVDQAKMQDIVNAQLEKAANRQITVKAALDAAAAEVDRLLTK